MSQSTTTRAHNDSTIEGEEQQATQAIQGMQGEYKGQNTTGKGANASLSITTRASIDSNITERCILTRDVQESLERREREGITYSTRRENPNPAYNKEQRMEELMIPEYQLYTTPKANTQTSVTYAPNTPPTPLTNCMQAQTMKEATNDGKIERERNY